MERGKAGCPKLTVIPQPVADSPSNAANGIGHQGGGHGGTDLQQVLKDAENDEILGKMKVSALLEALPKVGKVKAQEIMTELEIAPTRRLRGLGDRQRKALLEKFSS